MRKKQPAGIGMTPSTTELGNYIRTRRIELDLRQVSLADMCGFAQNFVSQLEIGTRRFPNNEQLVRLAKALQCDVEELRKRTPIKHVAQPTTELGRLIRARREEIGLTIEAFAKRLKIDPKRAKLMEMRRSPSIRYDVLEPLATALELDSSVLSRFVGITLKPTKSKMGQLIRSSRKELGLSIEELAGKLGVSRQFVNQIEFGQCGLSASDNLINKLSEVLKLDIAKLEAVRPKRKLQPANNPNSLGGFLAAKRLGLSLSQREVCERIEVSANVVSSVETGRLRPSAKLLEKFSRILNCDIPTELIPIRPVREHSHHERETGLGKFLTEKRQELKLSQAQLAQKAEISTHIVSGIERGTYRAGTSVLARISKAIGCEIPAELIPVRKSRQCAISTFGFTTERGTSLGKFVTDRRLELKLSQEEVARRANTSMSTISSIERGIYRPGSQMVKKLSKALECQIPDELVAQRGQRVPTESPVVVHLSEQNLADLNRIKELSDIRVNTEAVRKSLKILRILLEKQRDGHTVCLRKDGNIVELEFLF